MYEFNRLCREHPDIKFKKSAKLSDGRTLRVGQKFTITDYQKGKTEVTIAGFDLYNYPDARVGKVRRIVFYGVGYFVFHIGKQLNPSSRMPDTYGK